MIKKFKKLNYISLLLLSFYTPSIYANCDYTFGMIKKTLSFFLGTSGESIEEEDKIKELEPYVTDLQKLPDCIRQAFLKRTKNNIDVLKIFAKNERDKEYLFREKNIGGYKMNLQMFFEINLIKLISSLKDCPEYEFTREALIKDDYEDKHHSG